MFRRMDDDGSKSLQFQEFSKGIRDTGLECTNEEAKEMFNTFDKDKSGSVNIDEFLLAIRVSKIFFFRKLSTNLTELKKNNYEFYLASNVSIQEKSHYGSL